MNFRSGRQRLTLPFAGQPEHDIQEAARGTVMGLAPNSSGVELVSSTGKTTLTLQVAIPADGRAFLSLLSGTFQIKKDNGSYGRHYPNVFKLVLVATNESGLETIESLNCRPTSI